MMAARHPRKTARKVPGTTMNEMIARANIEHFELLLKSGIDDVKRATVRKLLAEEQDKLARILVAKRLAL
jgi:hypothetical protein